MKRIRRSLLYVPGNNPGLMVASALYDSDVVVLDLEDSVTLREKDAARRLVIEAIRARQVLGFGATELMVRLNGLSTPFFEGDIRAFSRSGVVPDSFRIPKVESPEEVRAADMALAEIEASLNIVTGTIEIVPIIESVAGLLKVEEISSACRRVTAITLGAEDFTRDLGTARTRQGQELFLARSRMVLAARSAGIDALDTIYPDTADPEGLAEEIKLVRILGFAGKSVIHPAQIEPVNSGFSPSGPEIEFSQRVINAAEEAEMQGDGVVSLDGRMVDPPVVSRARQLLDRAKRLGLAELRTAGEPGALP